MNVRLDELMSAFNDLRNRIEQLEQAIKDEKIKEGINRKPSIEDRWKPAEFQTYYTIDSGCKARPNVWTNRVVDDVRFDSYDYWETQERAEEIAKKVKLLFLMEQIHDILCPDYKQNWDGDCEVYFAFNSNRWEHDCSYNVYNTFTYFDTEEHAEQACQILNDMGIKPYGIDNNPNLY